MSLVKSLLFGASYAGLAIWATVLRIKPQYIGYFIAVTDLRYEQSALGHVFNYGTFYLESAGRENGSAEDQGLAESQRALPAAG